MSSDEAWSIVQRMSPRTQFLAVSLFCLPHTQRHTVAPFSGLLSSRLTWPNMKTVVTDLTSSYQQLQWKRDRKSSSCSEKQKTSLKKGNFFFNPAKVSTSLQLGSVPTPEPIPWSGDWTRFFSTVLKLGWNQLLQNGGGGIFIKNLWVLVSRSRYNRCWA